MAWWTRRRETDEVARAVALGPGDRWMAGAVDTTTQARVVATAHELVVVAPDGAEVARRRWLEVDRGGWENTTGTVSVTWVGSTRGAQWTFGPEEMRFPEVFRDRVEASRVIDAPVVVGDRTVGRAAIRKDLRTGELVPQLIFDRSVRRDDADIRAHGEKVLAFLAEQVGL